MTNLPNLADDKKFISDRKPLVLSLRSQVRAPSLADCVWASHEHGVPLPKLVTNFLTGIPVAFVFRDGTSRMKDLRRDWYVIYSKPHKEEQVRMHLGLKGIESFFPRLQLPGCAGGKKTVTPLFPNYLFARIDLATEAHWVMWAPGVKRIVSFSDQPVPLEDSVIEFLKEKADPAGVIHAHSRLSAGQQVEITGGPFDGFVGIIENPPNAKGRVKILLKLLSRPISVKLGAEFIRNQSIAIVPPTFSDRAQVLSAAN